MYSLQLKNEKLTVRSRGLLSEKKRKPALNTFAIAATPELEKLLQEFQLTGPPAWAVVAERLNRMPPQILEGVSTILFLRRTEPDRSKVRERLLSLKPHFVETGRKMLPRGRSTRADWKLTKLGKLSIVNNMGIRELQRERGLARSGELSLPVEKSMDASRLDPWH